MKPFHAQSRTAEGGPAHALRPEMRAADMAPEVVTYAQNLQKQIQEECRYFGVEFVKELVTVDPKKFIGKDKRLVKLQRLCDLMKLALTSKVELVSALESERVHGIYHTTDYLRFASDERLRVRGYLPSYFRWDGPEEPPEFDPNDEKVVVALVETFGERQEDIHRSIEYHWETLLEHSFGATMKQEMTIGMTTRGLIRVRPGMRVPFTPTRRWVKIKLDAEPWGPRMTRTWEKIEPIPGIEVLAACAQHPGLVALRRKEPNEFLWMPGLQIDFANDPNDPENEEHSWRVPYLNFGGYDVVMDAYYPERWTKPPLMPLFVK